MVTDIIVKNKDGGAGERSVVGISGAMLGASSGAQAGRPLRSPRWAGYALHDPDTQRPQAAPKKNSKQWRGGRGREQSDVCT